MALLVPDIGEQESIRYIVNNTQQTPRNLLLKLVSSASSTPAYSPAEADTPKSLRTGGFVEPYTYAAGVTDTSASPYGYQKVSDSAPNVFSTAPVYSNQYGILLHGTNWTVSTTAGGTNVTTASYPQQTFQFTSGSTYIHGYYVARANTISQLFLNNTTSGATVSASSFTQTAATAIATPVTTNSLGSKILALSPVQTAAANASQGTGQGAYNSTSILMNVSVTASVGDYVVGTGVGPYARVTAIVGTGASTVISVSVPCTGAVSGNLKFYTGKVVPGQTVADTSNLAIPAATTVTGYDPINGYVFMSAAFTQTVVTTANAITFSYLTVNATAHGGTNGDVIFLANGTAAITEQSYTIQNVTANAFDTWPAIASTVTPGTVTIYDSIMYEEKFTNGPYYIQNNGDQIKITLNVSLD